MTKLARRLAVFALLLLLFGSHTYAIDGTPVINRVSQSGKLVA